VADIALMMNIIILLGDVFVDATRPCRNRGCSPDIGWRWMPRTDFERIRRNPATANRCVPRWRRYDRAFRTIFDSHVTTLILRSSDLHGHGTDQGFGVTPHWHGGELIPALVVTRLIFDFLLAKTALKKLRCCMRSGDEIEFMRFSKFAFLISFALSRRSGFTGDFGRGNKMLGIDFAGGTI